MRHECEVNNIGNCQLIKREKGSWIIPSGTHYFGGNIISVTSSSDSAATLPPNVEGKPDNLAGDLDEMINAATVTAPDINGHSQTFISKDELMINLVPYLVERDHRILQHGIERGRAE